VSHSERDGIGEFQEDDLTDEFALGSDHDVVEALGAEILIG
jgi:hypothetical protein